MNTTSAANSHKTYGKYDESVSIQFKFRSKDTKA